MKLMLGLFLSLWVHLATSRRVSRKPRPPSRRVSRKPRPPRLHSKATALPSATPSKAPVTKYPTRKPSTVTPFPVNPFALMGTSHTAMRGQILQMEEDCLAAASNHTNQNLLSKTIQSVQTLTKMIKVHMQHENDGFFIATDNKFNCIAHNQGYREEHEHDEADEAILTNFTSKLSTPNVTLSTTQAVCAEIFQYGSEHEAHLTHEEKYLSPLTSQFPSGSGPAIVRYIVMTNFNTSYDFYFASALTQLVKRSTLTTVGSYVTAIKRVLTADEYRLVLPSIMNAVGSTVWPQLVLRGLNSTTSGTYTSADDLLLPAGIFDANTGCAV